MLPSNSSLLDNKLQTPKTSGQLAVIQTACLLSQVVQSLCQLITLCSLATLCGSFGQGQHPDLRCWTQKTREHLEHPTHQLKHHKPVSSHMVISDHDEGRALRNHRQLHQTGVLRGLFGGGDLWTHSHLARINLWEDLSKGVFKLKSRCLQKSLSVFCKMEKNISPEFG
jgi:hypothetical protein